MSYSAYEVYPSIFDEIPNEPANCFNCEEDCKGVFLDLLVRENEQDWDNLTFDERCDYNGQIFQIFDSKNYTGVNCLAGNFVCRVTHLLMYKGEARTLRKELKKKGYDAEIINDPNNRYKCMVVILKDDIIVNPFSLIDVYKTLPVRGGRK